MTTLAERGPFPTFRELPDDLWEKLESFEPFKSQGLPAREHARIIVAELPGTGEIVGYWMILEAVHVQPLWIHPDHHYRPGVIRGLWRGVVDTLKRLNVRVAFAHIGDADAAVNAPMAYRFGFRKLSVDTYFIDTDTAIERPADVPAAAVEE